MSSENKPTESSQPASPSEGESITDQNGETEPRVETATASTPVESAEASAAGLANGATAASSPARFISFLFLLGVIGLVSIIFYWVMAKFIIPLFLAALLVVIFRPVHTWILDKTGGREKLAAALTTLSILLAVLVPLALLLMMAAAESRDVFNLSLIHI